MIICHALENTCGKNPRELRYLTWYCPSSERTGCQEGQISSFIRTCKILVNYQDTKCHWRYNKNTRSHYETYTLHFSSFWIICLLDQYWPSYMLSGVTVARSSGPNKWTKAWNVITPVTWQSVLWLCSTGHYAMIIYVWDKRVLRVKVSTNINYIRTTGINWEWSGPTRESGHPDFNAKISQNK